VGMSIYSAFHEPAVVDPLRILTPLSGKSDQSYERKLGCTDTNDNFSDFSLRSPSDPQNSYSSLSLCGVIGLSTNTPTVTNTSTTTITPTPTIGPTPTITLSPTSTSAFYNPAVIINEIGWSGTSNSLYDQWIELYNPQSYPIIQVSANCLTYGNLKIPNFCSKTVRQLRLT